MRKSIRGRSVKCLVRHRRTAALKGKIKQKICAGYLQTEELSMQMQEETWTQESGREKSEEILQWHSISAACFSEVYSEKMYESRFIKWG